MNDRTTEISPKTRRWLIAFAVAVVIALAVVALMALMVRASTIGSFYVGLGVTVVVTPLIYLLLSRGQRS